MKKLLIFILVAITTLTISAQTSYDSCLIAWYPFTGSASDASGHNHNGSVNGAILTTDRFSNPNEAYSFNGASSSISIANIGDIINLSGMTLCAWIYPTGINTYNAIISKVNPNRDFNLKLDGVARARSEFNPNGNYYYCTSDTAIPVNSWSHIAATWDGSQWSLYINGVFQKLNSTLGYLPAWTGTRMDIGCMNGMEFFTGKLDDVRLYNCALSTADIQEIFTGIEETSTFEATVDIFPNPTSDKLNINFLNINPTDAPLQIFDITGRTVLTSAISSTSTTLDVKQLNAGVYILKVSYGEKMMIRRFVKN
ncbi:MAG: LamG-like jellyroll fold domain-containing protein [Bacteroidota bacterium]